MELGVSSGVAPEASTGAGLFSTVYTPKIYVCNVQDKQFMRK